MVRVVATSKTRMTRMARRVTRVATGVVRTWHFQSLTNIFGQESWLVEAHTPCNRKKGAQWELWASLLFPLKV